MQILRSYSRGSKLVIMFLAVVFLSDLSSCKKDDDAAKTCPIKHIVSSNASYDYVYTQGKLSTLEWQFPFSTASRKLVLTYDSKGQIEHISDESYIDGTLTGTESVDFVYGSNGKPSKVTVFLGPSSNPFRETTFTHDASGRLTLKENNSFGSIDRTRYEYDANDNVTKIYYQSGTTGNLGAESLGRTNTSFDQNLTFYSQSPGLEIIEIYLYDYIPTKHNILHADVDMPEPNHHVTPTEQVDFSIHYDASGMVKSMTGGVNIVPDFYFSSATYDCH